MARLEALRHLHVVQRVRDLLEQWFQADLFIVDPQGHISPIANFVHPGLKSLLETEAGQTLLKHHFQETGRKLSLGLGSWFEGPGGTPYVMECLRVQGEWIGSVVGFGCQEDARASFAADLVRLVAVEMVGFFDNASSSSNTALESRAHYDQMIGHSLPMQGLYGLLDRIKKSEAVILIQGENGTGKELIARSVHEHSKRGAKAFVTINCAAFNENLLESELFGHLKGSFTGAIRDKAGLFEQADQGTLFLDEVGDMPPMMQVKLLRVLQTGTFLPVGGTQPRQVSVRVLAATHRDLEDMVHKGQFREDLFYRLHVIHLRVPPLRERVDDLELLVSAFFQRECQKLAVPLKRLNTEAMKALKKYAWPGNIRELQNEIERLVVLTAEEVMVSFEDLSERIQKTQSVARTVSSLPFATSMKDAVEDLERLMISEGLKRNHWNKSKLAKELGISRASLIMKVEKYGLERRQVPRETKEAA
jgi:two-component system, NtrC family, response regulator HupR/HoxA